MRSSQATSELCHLLRATLPGVVWNGNSVGPEVDVRGLSVEAESLDVECSLVKHENVALQAVASLVERAQVVGLVGGSGSGSGGRGRSQGIGSGSMFLHHHVVVHHVHHVVVLHHHVVSRLLLVAEGQLLVRLLVSWLRLVGLILVRLGLGLLVDEGLGLNRIGQVSC